MTTEGFDPAMEEEILVLEDVPDPDLVLPVWEPTGVPDVDVALERLSVITEDALNDHPEIFGAIHADLRHVLGDLDSDKT